MAVYITNHQKRVPVPRKLIERAGRRLVGRKNLSVAVVTNAAIRKLNRRYLRHDYATDVLSFPMGGDLLGEVVVSTEYAAREARKRRIAVREELLRYVIHGILHLLDYDDRRPRDRARMWKRQEEELRKLFV